jgi:hypothetical protein
MDRPSSSNPLLVVVNFANQLPVVVNVAKPLDVVAFLV